MSGQIFRKVALERLSSPEQLDQLMKITTPKGWVALIALIGLLICAVFWGFLGIIPDRVTGQGILMKSGGVYAIVPDTSGRVQYRYFSVHDTVRCGQVVARLEQPQLLDQIRGSRAALAEFEKERVRIAQFGTREMVLDKESRKEQKENINSAIEALKEQVGWLNKKIEDQTAIMNMGLITKQQLIDTQEQLSDTEQKIREQFNQLKLLSIKEIQLKNQQGNDLSAIDQKINEAKRTLERLQYSFNEESKVISPYTGRILEVSVDEGSLVSEGQQIMTVELMGKEIKNLEAVLYFSPRDGKKIRLGMNAQISPSTVKQEQYGFIHGLVTSVSAFPSTHRGMMNQLQNEALVDKFSLGMVPVEVRAELIPDPRTASGFKWSSSKGPPIKVNGGTLCNATVTVSEQRPIDLVIPFFKKHVLGVGDDTTEGS
ncbi:MAG: NHLP bacteriocin system secretion protein [Deltaproteobacteria bacterium]|nr:NHLP bacteriocin system secretion protein [Deltaproteobacteria bacterium]